MAAEARAQEKAIYNFHRLKMPGHLYVCPKCRKTMEMKEYGEGYDQSEFPVGGENFFIHQPCRCPMIMFTRAGPL